jgi:hypothetical protein
MGRRRISLDDTDLVSLSSRLVISDANALGGHTRATLRDAARIHLDITATLLISWEETDYFFFFLAAGFFAAFFAGFFALAAMLVVLPL